MGRFLPSTHQFRAFTPFQSWPRIAKRIDPPTLPWNDSRRFRPCGDRCTRQVSHQIRRRSSSHLSPKHPESCPILQCTDSQGDLQAASGCTVRLASPRFHLRRRRSAHSGWGQSFGDLSMFMMADAMLYIHLHYVQGENHPTKFTFLNQLHISPRACLDSFSRDRHCLHGRGQGST